MRWADAAIHRRLPYVACGSHVTRASLDDSARRAGGFRSGDQFRVRPRMMSDLLDVFDEACMPRSTEKVFDRVLLRRLDRVLRRVLAHLSRDGPRDISDDLRLFVQEGLQHGADRRVFNLATERHAHLRG